MDTPDNIRPLVRKELPKPDTPTPRPLMQIDSVMIQALVSGPLPQEGDFFVLRCSSVPDGAGGNVYGFNLHPWPGFPTEGH